jgi:hypothetical protein
MSSGLLALLQAANPQLPPERIAPFLAYSAVKIIVVFTV